MTLAVLGGCIFYIYSFFRVVNTLKMGQKRLPYYVGEKNLKKLGETKRKPQGSVVALRFRIFYMYMPVIGFQIFPQPLQEATFSESDNLLKPLMIIYTPIINLATWFSFLMEEFSCLGMLMP